MNHRLKFLVASAVALAVGGCAAQSPAPGGSQPGTPSAAEQACLAAVTRESNNPDVVLLGSAPAQAGTNVRVGVGPQRAAWSCTAYRDGTTGDIFFMGGENDGSSAPPSNAGRPQAGSETDLSDFQGARAGQAEGGIRALGYEAVRSEGLTTWWFNRSTGACAQITTSNGRYSEVIMLPAQDC